MLFLFFCFLFVCFLLLLVWLVAYFLFLFLHLIDDGSVEELELFDNVVLRCVDRRYFRRGDCVAFIQSTM